MAMNANVTRKPLVTCHMLVRLALVPVNLALQKAFNTEVHNATKTNEQNKDVRTDSQPGYVLSMFLKFWLISASTFL